MFGNKRKDKLIEKLKATNEEHRKLNGKLREENEQLTKARYSLDRIELEQRIDKAIEELNNNEYDDSDFEGMRFQNAIISILKGDSNE